MASVRKRTWTHNGAEKTAWVVDYRTPDGKSKLKTFRSKKEADKGRLKIENEIEQGTHVADADSLTFAAAAERWLRDREARGKATGVPSIATRMQGDWAVRHHLNPAFGRKLVTAITGDDLEKYFQSGITTKRYNTQHGIRKVLRMILTYCIKIKVLKRNILVDEGVRVAAKRERIAVPDQESIRRLLAGLEGRVRYGHPGTLLQRRCYVYLAIFGGLRLGEISGLQWENVDFAQGIIRVRHSYSSPATGLRSAKTEAGLRDVAMVDAVRTALIEAHAATGKPETGFCFRGKSGIPYSTGGFHAGIWKPALDAAGLLHPDASRRYGRTPFHFHALRHANVSLLIAEGLPSINIARHIGHRSVSTTLDIYGHLFPEDQRVATSLASISGRLLPTTRRHEAATS